MNEHTLLPALGMDPRDPEFLRAHQRHVVSLVTSLAQSGSPPRRSSKSRKKGGPR